ncbi:histidyl-tRNA synthase [Flavobacterium psychrophilum]|uniref:Histidine--tRNA ligase n=3 Tax=Flavobacterium psychrophilum TaxID=96345 RepID=A6H160_FLAPJ|nr:histidine--tRNA ligase [Flavobacterium psychrophilum]AIG30769.1 histidyl-tRNA synthase [Flavobacterium psychrophilum]AIG33043.1 histidyl-tRNA synthase [Flavobacterium psychrophilum]AIG35199.1 histidyl-tRNA synthase [Flavobacterium psychrophilum]AIG37563.1 histidyl-tRNA synthase [Flavobacterium psychrophilum]AIG39828.1 histidyl-tRNA synthase [Flavobacterium psychrophilum]
MKPSIPKGTRDFSPAEVAKRQYIIQKMRTHFEKFGYQPIETPSFENSETLMGKYGEEGDRLIFKILNSGNFFFNKKKIELPESIQSLQLNSAETIAVNELVELNKFTNNISEKALRYDLTVPFARYVVQHQNEIEFPFKRYQIQPVWRADRPQKGRFREFYQCDADVVGSTSLWQEVELVQLYDSVFTDLGLNGVTIKINNRKILSGIAEVIGASNKLIDFTVALDKLDKIGEDGVKKEMIEKGISETAIEKVQPLFNFAGSISEKIAKLSVLLAASTEGMKGVEELQFICDNVTDLGLSSAILDLDVTLARGLNYYTGAIFEVAPPKAVAMGSIGGGGRYDDLTGIFGLKNMSGVGISFGLDRIYLVIEELGLFPETVTTTSKAIFLNFGQEETKYAMKAITQLRKEGIKVELYPDNAKIAKQFQYAEKRGILLAIIVGNDEMQNNQFAVKNLVSGEQQKVSFDELKSLLQ